MPEDREKKIHSQNDEEQQETPDVEAHKKAGRFANDEEGGDDVQAHVKVRHANDDDGGDEVEAHVKLGKE